MKTPTSEDGQGKGSSNNPAKVQMVNTEVLAGVDDDLKAKPNKRCNLASERFENVPSGHTGVKHKVHLLDPVFVNPNSTENIMQVLRHIGKSVGLTRYGGTERSWVAVCCDGSPFTIMNKLCHEYLVCMLCSQGCLGTTTFLTHAEKCHPDSPPEDVHSMREFDWMLPVTGDGHYKIIHGIELGYIHQRVSNKFGLEV